MDLATIQAGMASVQSGIQLTKLLASTFGTLDRAEQKLKLAELMSALADAKIALASALEQMADLDKKVTERAKLDAVKKWFVDGVYVLLDERDSPRDGPFCSRCFDVDSRLVRPANDRTGERGMGICPQCKTKFPLWNAEKRLVEAGVIDGYTG